jgi:hypothetical protein
MGDLKTQIPSSVIRYAITFTLDPNILLKGFFDLSINFIKNFIFVDLVKIAEVSRHHWIIPLISIHK